MDIPRRLPVLVQAIEILMDANLCDADTAMSSLRDRAQSNHLSIDEVAATVVAIASGEVAGEDAPTDGEVDAAAAAAAVPADETAT